MNEELKIKPYNRLRSILNEGELTDRASDNLDKILGVEENKQSNIFKKIFKYLKKIDSFIFKKTNKTYTNIPNRRRKR